MNNWVTKLKEKRFKRYDFLDQPFYLEKDLLSAVLEKNKEISKTVKHYKESLLKTNAYEKREVSRKMLQYASSLYGQMIITLIQEAKQWEKNQK